MLVFHTQKIETNVDVFFLFSATVTVLKTVQYTGIWNQEQTITEGVMCKFDWKRRYKCGQ